MKVLDIVQLSSIINIEITKFQLNVRYYEIIYNYLFRKSQDKEFPKETEYQIQEFLWAHLMYTAT